MNCYSLTRLEELLKEKIRQKNQIDYKIRNINEELQSIRRTLYTKSDKQKCENLESEVIALQSKLDTLSFVIKSVENSISKINIAKEHYEKTCKTEYDYAMFFLEKVKI